MESREQPLVSVCCLVYNHAPFLRECFEGFVMQKTNFPIEILVHDDASSDGSQEIIKEYTTKYPTLFKPIYQKENQYSKGIGVSVTYQFPRAKGRYIALCEGDDYWTDPYKLQKQVDFLERHQDFSICFHAVEVGIVKEDKFVSDFITRPVDVISDIVDLAKGNYIHTSSVVFKKQQETINDLKQIGRVVAGDYVLFLLLARHGKIYKMNKCMSVYRYGVGIWSGKEWNLKRKLDVIFLLSKVSVFLNNNQARLLIEKQIKVLSDQIIDDNMRLEHRLERITSLSFYRVYKKIKTFLE